MTESETPPAEPESAAPGPPADTPQTAPPDTPRAASRDTPQAAPPDTPQAAPPDTPRAASRDTPQAASPDAPRTAPPDTSRPASRDTPQAAPPAARPPQVPPPGRHNALPWLGALGFLVLACAIAYVGWISTQRPPQDAAALQSLADRVAQLEQRPPPGQPEGGQALEARVAALEQRPVPDQSELQARVSALQQQAADNARVTEHVDALSARMAAVAGRAQSAEGDLSQRLQADEAHLATLEQSVAGVTARLDSATRLARVQAAQTALAAGQPLGDLPNSPPAVARFATANPPTEAALRLAFPDAEQAALAAAHQDSGANRFFRGMLSRAEDLVTVRQGDRVLLGNPVAGVLARAGSALDAGDLAGAVAAVSALSGPPAQAMAHWLADARALLAARTGLADMAAHG